MAEPITTAALVITALAGAGAAYQQHEAGKYQEKLSKYQAKQAETEARERELVRKQKINKVLAAQIAGLGASGISAEGSPQLIASESVRQESLEGLADVATRSGQQRMLLSQGQNARRLGNLQAATSLLKTGASVYGSGKDWEVW